LTGALDPSSAAVRAQNPRSPGETGARAASPPAVRALAEAEARRRGAREPQPREINGRDGPEPVRYGDWEVRGLATDF
jgi:hypothetical protein